MSSIRKINELAPEVPRRSTALLGQDRMHRVTVLSPVTESAILTRPATRELKAAYAIHRTVLVRVEGESKPRRIEYSRLSEFAQVATEGVEA